MITSVEEIMAKSEPIDQDVLDDVIKYSTESQDAVTHPHVVNNWVSPKILITNIPLKKKGAEGVNEKDMVILGSRRYQASRNECKIHGYDLSNEPSIHYRWNKKRKSAKKRTAVNSIEYSFLW